MNTPVSPALLAASGLCRRLGGRVLWQDVRLEVQAGESVAVVGPSGSGKTLLLRALAGLDPLQGGTVTFRGRPQPSPGQPSPNQPNPNQPGWSMPQYRAHVTYLPQRPALYPGTVQMNLQAPFALKIRAGTPYPAAAVGALLQALGRTPDFLALDASGLSGGEGQLLALARTLLTGPAVLLLDEATASLDPEATRLAESVLLQWLHAAPERALVWVSHDPAQRARVSSRALTLTPEPA